VLGVSALFLFKKESFMEVVDRPWGYFLVLDEDKDSKTKKIVVHPNQRLSLQRHCKRDEHWFITHGLAVVTMNDAALNLKKGQQVTIPRMVRHRVHNTGTEDLVFIEIQTGEYFGEDDIERFEDDYERE